MRLGKKCFAYALVLFCMGAVGFGQQMNAKDAPCKSAGVNSDISECMFKAWKVQDAELNRVHAQARKGSGGAELQRLINAQRLWVQFRDANCDAAYGLYGGGSAGPIVRSACLEKDTRERVKELGIMYLEPR